MSNLLDTVFITKDPQIPANIILQAQRGIILKSYKTSQDKDPALIHWPKRLHDS